MSTTKKVVKKKILKKVKKGPAPFVQGLAAGLSRIGGFVEKFVGRAQEAKTKYEQRGGPSILLSLESKLPADLIQKLFRVATERFVTPMLPILNDKNALEMGQGSFLFLSHFMERKTRNGFGFALDDALIDRGSLSSQIMLARGSSRMLPFEDQFFDYAIARLNTPLQNDVVGPVKEIGRILAPEGEGVIIDYHPFGLYAKSGANRLRGLESTIRGVEDYFKICKLANLTITDLRESFIDETVRQHFTTNQNDLQSFKDLRASPLLVVVFVKRARPQN